MTGACDQSMQPFAGTVTVRQLVLAAGIIVAIVAAGGCGSGRPSACSEVGCFSGVFVNIEPLRSSLPQARRVILCLDRTCSRGNAYVDAVRTIARSVPSPTGAHEVLLAVQDRNGKSVLTVRRRVTLLKEAPNGVACGPVCFGRGLKLNVNARSLEAA